MEIQVCSTCEPGTRKRGHIPSELIVSAWALSAFSQTATGMIQGVVQEAPRNSLRIYAQ